MSSIDDYFFMIDSAIFFGLDLSGKLNFSPLLSSMHVYLNYSQTLLDLIQVMF